ncbi:MAG: MMPL family transporter [Woeseiaceae bacterium]|nr:MMPL family transporter [Woeseiaceae bacterium]
MAGFQVIYRRAHDVARRRSRPVMAAAALLLVTVCFGLTRTTLDLSFQPLAASSEALTAPTREFEAVFGQSSGAWIAVIVEAHGASTAELLHALAKLTRSAGAVPGVSEVQSLTGFSLPVWDDGVPGFVEPLPDWLLEPGEEAELEAQYRELLDGTRFVGWLVSADGSRLLLGARIDLPLADLDGRRVIVREFKRRLEEAAPPGIRLHFGGVSVVEVAYEELVLRDQLIATALTSVVLAVLLWWCFGNLRAVLVCLLPVTLAVPATLGAMGWLELPVTIINTVIPALVMVIGVADAVHMVIAARLARAAGANRHASVTAMLDTTGRACFFTTVTTLCGFLALAVAELEAVASFGLCAAIGILLAWLSNQLLLPWLLRRVDVGAALPDNAVNRLVNRALSLSLRLAERRPRLITATGIAATLACCLAIPSLEVNQHFNEELADDHPLTRAQQLLDRDFGGFLGPEISIRRPDGGEILDADSLTRLDHFVADLRALPHTSHAWSVRDLLPRQLSSVDPGTALDALRQHPQFAWQVRELADTGHRRLAVIVRTGDIGTREAARYREQIERLVETHWNANYDVQIVGQWWLAQRGMRLLLRDMLVSVATAALLVLPILWLLIGERCLRFAAIAANLLPLLLPLAFMAVTGITLRIGTAVVLVIALGLVVDNTLHVVLGLREVQHVKNVGEEIDRVLRAKGRAILFTTLALVGAFLSMLVNDLLAIRDMGLVAAVTFVGAMLADIVLLPAIYVLLRPSQRTPASLQRQPICSQ